MNTHRSDLFLATSWNVNIDTGAYGFCDAERQCMKATKLNSVIDEKLIVDEWPTNSCLFSKQIPASVSWYEACPKWLCAHGTTQHYSGAAGHKWTVWTISIFCTFLNVGGKIFFGLFARKSHFVPLTFQIVASLLALNPSNRNSKP